MKLNDKPYPEVKVERPNTHYAKILLQDYAGTVSEQTAINLYMYQHFLQADKWKKFADLIEEIAIVEMHHLELLGETILKLGLNPVYATFDSKTDNKIYWSSKNVNYTDKIKEMLEEDIKAETLAINQYHLHMKMIDDKYIKALLLRIIEDEVEHLEIFKELYKSIQKEKL